MPNPNADPNAGPNPNADPNPNPNDPNAGPNGVRAAEETRQLRATLRALGEYADTVLADENRDRQVLAETLSEAVTQLGCQTPGTGATLSGQLVQRMADVGVTVVTR